jgi:hypothetical protein
MQKKIPFHKIDRAVRFKKSEIEQWVENGHAENCDQISLVALTNVQELFTNSNGKANND